MAKDADFDLSKAERVAQLGKDHATFLVPFSLRMIMTNTMPKIRASHFTSLAQVADCTLALVSLPLSLFLNPSIFILN